MKRFTFAVLLTSLFSMTATAIPQDKKATQHKRVQMKEILIKFKPDAKPAQIKEIPALELQSHQ